MFNPETDAIALLADGLTLVYHEGRHVRHLVKAGHVEKRGWEHLLSLPTNRVEAWRALLPTRLSARDQKAASAAEHVFEHRFSKSTKDLEILYALPHWRHASAVGGHAWRGVTAAIAALSAAIQALDEAAIVTCANALLSARHNNGQVRSKIRGLDTDIGVNTGSWWNEPSTSGA